MPSTRSFGHTIRTRLERDPAFRDALLTEAVERLLAGEVDLGKILLLDFINATIGFDRLAAELEQPPERLKQMLGPEGEPTASNLFAMLDGLQQASGIRLHVAAS